MSQSSNFDGQLASLKSSIQSVIQAVASANEHSASAGNAHKLQGYSYQDIIDAVMGATTLTIADLAQQHNAHTTSTDNPHGVTKDQVGLSLVQNFALSVKADLKTKTPAQVGNINDQYVTPQTAYYLAEKAIEQISGSAPETLDTINEIAAALNNNPDIINNILVSLGEKASTNDLNVAIGALTADDIDLGNVDNYSTATPTEARNANITDRFMTPNTTHTVVEEAVIALMSDMTEEFNSGADLINPPAS